MFSVKFFQHFLIMKNFIKNIRRMSRYGEKCKILVVVHRWGIHCYTQVIVGGGTMTRISR